MSQSRVGLSQICERRNGALNVLGVVTSYSDLHCILRQRAEELEISHADLDAFAGLQDGYSSMLLAPNPTKRLGATSFGLLLPALAIKLVAIEDEEALARLKSSSRVKRRSSKNAKHAAVVHWQASRRFLRKILRLPKRPRELGGINRR
jgi:hypothetical protein